MKIIDFELKGNMARLFLGRDDLRRWWGDDWDDAPYEHNAGRVYEEFVAGHMDIAFPFDAIVLEPCDGHLNSPWSKEDMQAGKVPVIVAMMHPQEQDRWSGFDDMNASMGMFTFLDTISADPDRMEEIAAEFDRREQSITRCGCRLYMGQHVDDFVSRLPEGCVVMSHVKKDIETCLAENREMALRHLTWKYSMEDEGVDYLDRLAYALFWVDGASELVDEGDEGKIPSVINDRIIELIDRDGNEGIVEALRRIDGCESTEYVEKLCETLGCEFDRNHLTHNENAVTERLIDLIGS